jgi:hypothetical protein
MRVKDLKEALEDYGDHLVVVLELEDHTGNQYPDIIVDDKIVDGEITVVISPA